MAHTKPKHMSKRKAWLSIVALRYCHVLMAFLLWLYIIFKLLGTRLYAADCFAHISVLPAIVLISVSNTFHFCKIHKLMTVYAALLSICISFRRFIIRSEYDDFLTWAFAISGAVLFVYFALNFRSYNRSCRR